MEPGPEGDEQAIKPLGFCLGCDYALLAREGAAACPECGRAYDAADPATFETRSREHRFVRRTRIALTVARWLLVGMVPAAFVVGDWMIPIPPMAAIAVSAGMLGLVGVILTLQNRVAARMLGNGYALRQLVLALLLLPLLLLGPLLVPTLVLNDIRRERSEFWDRASSRS